MKTDDYENDIKQLRDQLAAAEKEVQPLVTEFSKTKRQLEELVNALHVLYTSKDQDERREVYHAALAKMEGK